MNDTYEEPAFDIDQEDDFESEDFTARGGRSDTVVSILNRYMADPFAWDFGPARERIDAIIGARSEADQRVRNTAAANKREHRRKCREPGVRTWNGGLPPNEVVP